jgi:hypothetical protein
MGLSESARYRKYGQEEERNPPTVKRNTLYLPKYELYIFPKPEAFKIGAHLKKINYTKIKTKKEKSVDTLDPVKAHSLLRP